MGVFKQLFLEHDGEDMKNNMTRKTEQAVYERAKWKCECCGREPDWRGLAIHHIKARQMGGTKREYNLEDLELLCGRCHSKKHGIKEG